MEEVSGSIPIRSTNQINHLAPSRLTALRKFPPDEQIANGAQVQAASLEQTSASLEEITVAIRQTADNGRQANQPAISPRDQRSKVIQSSPTQSPPWR
jgi:hypothetical protein